MDRKEPMTIPEPGLLDIIGFQEVRHCKIYDCTKVKLKLLHKSRRKRNPNEIRNYFVCTANAQAWMSCILCQYAPARTIWKNTRLIMALNHRWQCFCKSACAIVKYTPPHDTKLEYFCLYNNYYQLIIELSGRKGSATYGLGDDISLPPCLATSIWNLAPKATSGPKSRGALFGTTLWYHVLLQWYFVGACAANLELNFFPYSWRKYPQRVD